METKKKYWLRGGLVSAGLFVVVLTISGFVSDGGFGSCGDMGCANFYFTIIYVLGTPLFFIVGSLIGLLYGKMRIKKLILLMVTVVILIAFFSFFKIF